MKKIILYMKPYFPRMFLGLMIKFTGTVTDLLLPWILAKMIDVIAPQKNIPLILIWGGIMLLCSGIAVFTNIVANRMASFVARNTTERLRHDLFRKILFLSCSQIDDLTIPSLEARLTTDTYNIHQMVGMMQRLGVRAPILLLGGIGITMSMEPVLTLVLLATLPFISLLVWFVTKKGIPLYTQLQQAVDRMVRIVRENINGVRIIKALSKTEYEKVRFFNVNADVVEKEKKAGITMALTNPVMNLLLNVGLTFVIIVGAFRVNAGLTTPGKIIAFLSYFTMILNAMLFITRMFVLYSKGSASAGRIAEVLELSEDLLVGDTTEAVGIDNHIVFDHVSFSYLSHTRGKRPEAENLHDISFCIKRGETLGIIGATGSGKSTLIQLLMRLYDACEGTICIDGRPVSTIPGDELHGMFGVVFQNDTLFASSIEENIDFGRELPRQNIRQAAKMAQAEEFILDLSDQFEHPLNAHGTNLSGGQKQRLLIARALAANPPILILDDASSALDYKTDALLRQAIKKSHRDTTAIVIAGRISSIMASDHILVLEEGQMLGYGTHNELMQNCELYRTIYDNQMGGDSVAKV